MTDALSLITPHDFDVASQVALALAGPEEGRTPTRRAAHYTAGYLRVGYLKARSPVTAVLAACACSVAEAVDAARYMEAGWAVNAGTLDRLDGTLQALGQWCAAGASPAGSAFCAALGDTRNVVAEERASLVLAKAHTRRDAERIAKATLALSAHHIEVRLHANNLMTVIHPDGTREVRQTLAQVEQLAAAHPWRKYVL